MTVGQIIRAKGGDVVTLTPDATLETVASTLASKRIGAIVLTNEDGRVAGIVSERDVVRVVGLRGAETLGEPVEDVMTMEVETCDERTTLDEALSKMTNGRFRHLPILRDGALVGIVSIGDIVKAKIDAAERETSQMREYIAAG